MLDTLYEETFKNGESHLHYQNIGIYGQALWNTSVANLSIGGRYDYSTEFGDAFVPRLGITKATQRVHFKIMGSKSFRTPGGILPNRIPEGYHSLKPEMGTIIEFETGYVFAPNSIVLLNLYDITFNDIIIYGKEPLSGVGYYKNEGRIGTTGIEVEMKYNSDRISCYANFSHYIRKRSDSDSLFMVPGINSQYLALSPYRLNGYLRYAIKRNINISATASFFAPRYSYDYWNEPQNRDQLVKHPQMLLMGLNIDFHNFPFKDFSTQFSLTNILNAKFSYLQPYKGAHGPLPALDRSIGFKIYYEY